MTIFFALLGTALLLVALFFAFRRKPSQLEEKKPIVTSVGPAHPPPLDPVVAALLNSLDKEPSRWDVHPNMAFRDDFIAISSDGKKGASVHEDYKAGRTVDPVKIPGEHNGMAVEQAIRLANERRKNPSPTYDDLRRKLGV